MHATKTTFYLADTLRTRLKALAAHRGKTLTELLTEGARLVLDRHETSRDQEELDRRAVAAREKLRRGLYSGPSVSDGIDEIVYPAERRRAP